MLLTSFLFILSLGFIAFISVALSLITPISFSPIVFPISFVVVVLIAVFIAPYAQNYLCRFGSSFTFPRAGDERIRVWTWNYLLYFALVPVICLMLFFPALQIGYHGLFHSAYVYEILLRGLPPENVTLVGYPANDYWPYHIYLTILARLFNIPPTFASTLSNIVILTMACLWMVILWKTIRREPSTPPAFYILFPLLGANLFYFLNIKFIGWISTIPQAALFIDDLRAADTRLDFSIIRFINFNGFSVGILFFLVTLVIAMRLLQGKLKPIDANLLFFLTGSTLLFHATTGIFILLVLIPALAITRMSINHTDDFRSFLVSRRLDKYKWVIAPALFLLVPGLFLYQASNAMNAGIAFEWTSWTDWSSIFIVAYPTAPLFFLGLFQAWKNRDHQIIFLSFIALWGFLSAVLIKLPDGNEYKFIYLSSITFGLVAMIYLKELVNRPGFWRRGLLAFFCVTLVFNIGNGTWFFFTKYHHRHKYDFAYQGMYVSASDKNFTHFTWIQQNTPIDTIVIHPFTSKDWNYEYFSARLPYVVAGHIYNEGLPETDARRGVLESIYNPDVPMEIKMTLLHQVVQSMNRPVAVVYALDREFFTAIERSFGVRGEIISKTIVVYLLGMP